MLKAPWQKGGAPVVGIILYSTVVGKCAGVGFKGTCHNGYIMTQLWWQRNIIQKCVPDLFMNGGYIVRDWVTKRESDSKKQGVACATMSDNGQTLVSDVLRLGTLRMRCTHSRDLAWCW